MADSRYFKNLKFVISLKFPCDPFQNLKSFEQGRIDILNYISVIIEQYKS